MMWIAIIHSEVLMRVCGFDMQVSIDQPSLKQTLISKKVIYLANHESVHVMVGWWWLRYSMKTGKDDSPMAHIVKMLSLYHNSSINLSPNSQIKLIFRTLVEHIILIIFLLNSYTMCFLFCRLPPCSTALAAKMTLSKWVTPNIPSFCEGMLRWNVLP